MSVGDLVDREERPAMVAFEKRPVEDKIEGRKQGKVVYKDVIFALVTPPYSRDRFEYKAEKWFDNVRINVRNGRVPPKYLEYWESCYQKFLQGEEAPLNGTSVKNWSAITPAQCKTILMSGIKTIEDLALINDEGMRRLGMGGVDLKNKAKAYVKTISDSGSIVMENAALKKQNDQLQGTIASLTEKVEILGQRLEAMKSTPLAEVSRESQVYETLEITADDILPIDYSGMKMHEIRALCKQKGIKTSPSDKKVDLIEKLA